MSKAKPAHNISQYRDGNVWVAFCTVCSQEGSDLSNPCHGKFMGIKKPSVDNVDRQDVKDAKAALKEGNFVSLEKVKNELDKAKEPS